MYTKLLKSIQNVFQERMQFAIVFQFVWWPSNPSVLSVCVLATFSCQVCKKVFKKTDALRRHKRIHASHKPVLVCPRDNCQAYFSTTFNLQHHIRKVHLELLKYKCSFPDCPRMFAMRVCNMLWQFKDAIFNIPTGTLFTTSRLI